MSTETPLGLIVPVDADAPNGPAQIGGNAEKTDALLQKGGVSAHFVSKAKLTRTATTYGSFSTPVKVELTKVTADQLVEIDFYTFIKGGTLTTPPIPRLALVIGGSIVRESEETLYESASNWLAAIFKTGEKEFFSKGSSVSEAEAKAIAESSNYILQGTTLRFKFKPSEEKPVAIEIQSKIASGSVEIWGAYLAARARA